MPDGSYIAEVAAQPKSRRRGHIRLRAIEYQLPGAGELYRLVTTIMDPTAAPVKDLALLYHERWDIEGFLKQIKSVQLNGDKIYFDIPGRCPDSLVKDPDTPSRLARSLMKRGQVGHLGRG